MKTKQNKTKQKKKNIHKTLDNENQERNEQKKKKAFVCANPS